MRLNNGDLDRVNQGFEHTVYNRGVHKTVAFITRLYVHPSTWKSH